MQFKSNSIIIILAALTVQLLPHNWTSANSCRRP